MSDLYRTLQIPDELPAAGWPASAGPFTERWKLTILGGVETRLHVQLLRPRGVPVELTGLGTTQQLRLRVQAKPVEGLDRPFDLSATAEPQRGPNAALFTFTAVQTKRAQLDGFEFGFYDIVLINGSDDPETAVRESVVPLSPFQLQKGLQFP